jgi:hypothetical protein
VSGQVEYGDRGRGDTFPDTWGAPRGAPYSEERAAWVRRNVRVEQVRNLNRETKRSASSAHVALAKALALE